MERANHQSPRKTNSVTYGLAAPADDAELRRLLRENPMPNAISLSFECEPCYDRAAAIQGPLHQTIIGRRVESGALIGMGSRSVRPTFVNGSVQPVGYLSQLRLDPELGRGLYLARAVSQAFAFFRTLHADGRAPFYFGSIIEENGPARRLMSSGLPDFPMVREYARLHTYAVCVGRRKPPLPLPAGLCLARGSTVHIGAIVDCLMRNGARRQLAPYWTAAELFSPERTPGLAPDDFCLALEGKRVIGCVACWDQSGFKQTVVRGYAPKLTRWRRPLNLAARLGGWPVLPAPGTPLHYCYASHLAVDDDNPIIFAALLRELYNRALERGYDYVMIGLSEANPLRSVLTAAYRHLSYISRLYLLAWQAESALLSALDGRIAGPEIAVL